jgi:hypothetical protein
MYTGNSIRGSEYENKIFRKLNLFAYINIFFDLFRKSPFLTKVDNGSLRIRSKKPRGKCDVKKKKEEQWSS